MPTTFSRCRRRSRAMRGCGYCSQPSGQQHVALPGHGDPTAKSKTIAKMVLQRNGLRETLPSRCATLLLIGDGSRGHSAGRDPCDEVVLLIFTNNTSNASVDETSQELQARASPLSSTSVGHSMYCPLKSLVTTFFPSLRTTQMLWQLS